MPDTREFQSNAVSTSSNASPENLEEAKWRLKVQDNQEGMDAHPNRYPDRPGEPDCIYYLRTGLCGYGNNCRYNHPTYIGLGTQDRGELPEKVGQPDCQYFLKTGTCKFGATCKYHHPRERHDARLVALNILGLPMRQDEKPCPYYMRTGTCKFGIVCKFNHPQPSTTGTVFPVTGPSAYGSAGSSVVPPSSLPLIGGLSAWPLARSPYMSSPRMQGLTAYMPVILPPSQATMPVQHGWSTYTGTVSHVQPPNEVIGPTTQISNSKLHPQSGSLNLPERPDQPECQYYMKTGSCRYGTTCKYHHPREWNSAAVGPLGLPLRPGQAVCTFYSMYGNCRYGSACKFDHPLVGYYNYALPAALSVPPNPRNSQTLRLPDRPVKSNEKINNQVREDSIDDNNNNKNEHGNNHPSAPSSESPRNHSD